MCDRDFWQFIKIILCVYILIDGSEIFNNIAPGTSFVSRYPLTRVRISVFCQAFKATPTTDDILTVLCGLAGSYTRPILVLFGNGISSEITFSISRIEP